MRLHDYNQNKINGFRAYDCTSSNSSAICVRIKCDLEGALFIRDQRIEVKIQSHVNDQKYQQFYEHSKFTPKFAFEVEKVPYKQMQFHDMIER